MALHDPTEEQRSDQLEQLIAARKTSTENDILAGRAATVRAVAELCADLNCDADEAEALVRAAVLGRSTLVGARIAEVVQHAIYAHVVPLAEGDLADMERCRRQSFAEQRIERALDARAA